MDCITSRALSWAAVTLGITASLGLASRLEVSSAELQVYPEERLQPRYFGQQGAERVRLRYGPFTAPSMEEHMGMKTFNVDNIAVPCKDCYVTWWTAGLEYPDGSHANANTSMWLHHLAVLNTKRQDVTCTELGRKAVERSLVAGNEREPIDLTIGGTSKTGYYIGANDTFVLVHELMNMVPDPRAAVVTLEWEYITAASAAAAGGFAPVRAAFLDIDGACGSFTDTSDVDVPAGMTVFKLSMEPAWTAAASAAGRIVTTFGHVHDGGVLLETTRNGRVVCATVPVYGGSPGFVDPPPAPAAGGEEEHHHMPGMDMGYRGGGLAHVSSMQPCEGLGRIEAGDVWSVVATYNLTARPAMVDHHGETVPIMGIVGLYFA